MAKNKVEKVADILGVRLNKKFKLKNVPFYYLLKEDGLYRYEEGNLVPVATDFLLDILMGRYEVVSYWQPSEGERYYTPKLPDEFDGQYASGLVCKTKKEAQDLTERILRYTRKLRGLK